MNKTVLNQFWELINDFEDYLTSGYRRPGENLIDAALIGPEKTAGPALSGAYPPREQSQEISELRHLENVIGSCAQCGLQKRRKKTVPGSGVLNPKVMIVGTSPGTLEDSSGKPFVGPAGRFLAKWLSAIDLDLDSHCFITNLVKCYPGHERAVELGEGTACFKYLENQIRLVKPDVILALGAFPCRFLTETASSLEEVRGRDLRHGEVPLICTYDPGVVLLNQSLKRYVWEDLKRLRQLLPHG